LLQHVGVNLRVVFDDVAAGSPSPLQLSDEAVSAALLFGRGREHNQRQRVIGFGYWSWLAAHSGELADNEEIPTGISGRVTKLEFLAGTPEVHAIEANSQASLILMAFRHS
jgi:hypothetical protein